MQTEDKGSFQKLLSLQSVLVVVLPITFTPVCPCLYTIIIIIIVTISYIQYLSTSAYFSVSLSVVCSVCLSGSLSLHNQSRQIVPNHLRFKTSVFLKRFFITTVAKYLLKEGC